MNTDKMNHRFCEKFFNNQKFTDPTSFCDGFPSDCNSRKYHREHPMTALALMMMIGLALLMPFLEQLPSVLATQKGETVTVTGTVTESREGNGYLWLKLCDESMSNKNAVGKQEVLYVSLPRDWEDMTSKAPYYPAGTKLQITGILEQPQGQRNPGGFDEKQWLLSRQARMKLMTKRVDAIQLLQPPQGIWKISDDVGCCLKEMTTKFLSEEQRNLTLALLLGEKQQLDQSFYRLTQRMGIAHIFAVSGLHVGFVGALLLFLFRLIGLERSWISFGCLAVMLSFYCIVTGLQPSAIRAAMMLLLAALALRLLRPPAAIDFLSLAAIVLLLDNPFLLYTAGFQLSFGVTLVLLLFVRPVQKKLSWIGSKRLRDSLAVAIAAYLGSVPLTAWHFYTLSMLSPLYNLLLVPIVSLLVPLLLLAFFAATLLPTAGSILFVPVKLLLDFLLSATTLLHNIFGTGHWYIGKPGWLAVCCYMLFLVCLWRWLTNKNANSIWRTGSVMLLLMAACVSMPSVPGGDELLYMDVGQGSCAVLRTEQGETVIFDGGLQQRELASCLAWYGVNEVKAIVLSHADVDHINGIVQVLENIPVQYLCIEQRQAGREETQALMSLARESGVMVKRIERGAIISLENGTIQLEVISDKSSGTNSRELTAVVQLDRCIVAFPGDLSVYGVETFVQRQPHIDIWTVPHHGSHFSASEALYQQLQKKGVKLAVISSGNDNRYGHPHWEVLQLLRQFSIPVHRIDQSGALRLFLDDV